VPYRDYVTSRILTPLDLTSTGFVRPEGSDDRLAIGHRRVGDAWEPLPFSGPGGFSSIGGLFSTVTDLSRWARWLSSAFAEDLDGEADGDLGGILSRASRRELQQAYRTAPALPTQPSGYGFGLFVEEQPGLGAVVSHSGGYPGFSAHMRWHPASGLGIVAFENATAALVSAPAASALHGLLRDAGAEPVPTIWPETASARVLVEEALGGEELPAAWVSENIELDVSLERRRAAWHTGLAEIGGLDDDLPTARALSLPTSIDRESGEESLAPSHLVWRLPGRRGRLRVEIRLTPESPPRLQTLNVRAERL
jgi:CubicO group peptidase (beta-lactamase class C family)